jgi:hypothetical protein
MSHLQTGPTRDNLELRPPNDGVGGESSQGGISGGAPGRSPACLNCGAPLAGAFCAECGQRDVPPYPSVRELVVDAFWELSGWDGRFATTVRALIARPGKLTREFLEGRRARYISPLRLYLMCSLVYFLGAAAAPNVRLDDGRSMFVGIRVTPDVSSSDGPSRPERVGNAASEAFRSQQPLAEEQKKQILSDIQKAPSFMQPFLRRSITDPGGFRRSMFEAMPRMLFVLLPIFAVIVALFYHGRKYPEHLYFAIHLHAYAFLALALIELAKFTQAPTVVGVVAALSFLSVPVYATLAFRRTYGGSVVLTLVKEAGIGTIYFATSVVAFATMIYIISVID